MAEGRLDRLPLKPDPLRRHAELLGGHRSAARDHAISAEGMTTSPANR